MKFAKLCCVWSLLFAVSSARGGDPTIVLLPDGTAWFSAGSESPTILVKNIIRAPSMPPGGGGPDNPQPPATSEDRKAARELADAVDDPVGATMLSKTYGLIGEYIASGKIPAEPAAIDKALTEAVDTALAMIPGRRQDDWEKVHQQLVDRISPRIVAGKLDRDQWATVFRDFSQGLGDSTSGAAIPPFLEPLIAALMKILIEILSGMFV